MSIRIWVGEHEDFELCTMKTVSLLSAATRARYAIRRHHQAGRKILVYSYAERCVDFLSVMLERRIVKVTTLVHIWNATSTLLALLPFLYTQTVQVLWQNSYGYFTLCYRKDAVMEPHGFSLPIEVKLRFGKRVNEQSVLYEHKYHSFENLLMSTLFNIVMQLMMYQPNLIPVDRIPFRYAWSHCMDFRYDGRLVQTELFPLCSHRQVYGDQILSHGGYSVIIPVARRSMLFKHWWIHRIDLLQVFSPSFQQHFFYWTFYYKKERFYLTTSTKLVDGFSSRIYTRDLNVMMWNLIRQVNELFMADFIFDQFLKDPMDTMDRVRAVHMSEWFEFLTSEHYDPDDGFVEAAFDGLQEILFESKRPPEMEVQVRELFLLRWYPMQDERGMSLPYVFDENFANQLC